MRQTAIGKAKNLMLKCSRCGKTNLDGAQFCDRCGARLAARRQIAVQPEIWRSDSLFANEDKLNITTQSNRRDAAKSPVDDNGFAARRTNLNSEARAANFEQSAPQTFGTLNAHALLRVERGKNAGKEFFLSTDEINIGRWDADNGVFPDVDLDADDPEAKISRRHARIVRRADGYSIEDLNSTNGTFVNRGRRLTKGNSQILSDNDEIIVGKTFLRFQIIR